jgi:hypothetical protein
MSEDEKATNLTIASDPPQIHAVVRAFRSFSSRPIASCESFDYNNSMLLL